MERNVEMLMSPMTAKLVMLGVLCAAWLTLFHHVKRLNAEQPFHVAAYQRDRRKARFYFLTVWSGLIAAFLSLLSLDALATVEFDSIAMREVVLGVTRAVGLWGLLIVGAVWSQVGTRVSQVNSDGQSLTPIPEDLARSRPGDRRL